MVGDTVDIFSLHMTQNTIGICVEGFQNILDEALAGNNVGLLLSGIQKFYIEQGAVLANPGTMLQILDEALASNDVSLLLRGIQKSYIQRGAVLAKPGTITLCTKLPAIGNLLTEEGSRPSFILGRSPQFYMRTRSKVSAIMDDKDEEMKMVLCGLTAVETP